MISYLSSVTTMSISCIVMCGGNNNWGCLSGRQTCWRCSVVDLERDDHHPVNHPLLHQHPVRLCIESSRRTIRSALYSVFSTQRNFWMVPVAATCVKALQDQTKKFSEESNYTPTPALLTFGVSRCRMWQMAWSCWLHDVVRSYTLQHNH